MTKKAWVYRTQIQMSKIESSAKAFLCFDGLDTVARVTLDGELVLSSENMFISHRVDVSRFPKESPLTLQIVFCPADRRGRDLQQENPEHKWICDNGDPSRLAVRKAQYHWGWDWGPELLCAGIWRPVRLETYSMRVDSVNAKVHFVDDGSASVGIIAKFDGECSGRLTALVSIWLNGALLDGHCCDVKSGEAQTTFNIASPARWMPAGYGTQDLYDVHVSLFCDETQLDNKLQRIGLRHVELVQALDQHGKSFYLRINGVDIFCGGSCWIPADSFLTNVTPNRYRSLLELVVNGNQNMLR